MFTHNTGNVKWSIPDQIYMGHDFPIISTIGLLVTDNSLKVKESWVFLSIQLMEWPDNVNKLLLGEKYIFSK